MKKLLRSLAVISAVMFFGMKAEAVMISSRVVSDLATQSLLIQSNESLVYIASGVFTGTARLEKSFDGTNYQPVGISTTNNSLGSYITGIIRNEGSAALYRWKASTWTAGQFEFTLYDVDDPVSQVINNKRVPTVTYTDERIYFPMLNLSPQNSGTAVAVSSKTYFTRDLFDKSFMILTSTGGGVVMANTPTISTDTAVVGDIYVIQSATDTVTFQDHGTLAGSTLQLGSTTRALGVGDILVLLFRGGFWWEMGFYNN